MPLSDIVDVVITRQTQTVTEAGFGIPLILGTSLNFTQRVKEYSSMQGVALDFDSSAKEYIAAQDIFSQQPAPNLIMIGRRAVDEANITIQSAVLGQTYGVIINGQTISASGTPTATYSVVTLNGLLQPGNRITPTVNGTVVGTITSEINFDIDFVTLNNILATVNGVALTPVLFNTDQATTMADLATEIETAANVLSATVTGARQITVVFNTTGANTVNSVVTTLGATQPVATISQGSFVYTTSSANTMNLIATAIDNLVGIDASVGGLDSNILTVAGAIGVTATVNSFTIQGGLSQPVATITNPLQNPTPEQVALALTNAINAASLPVTATDNLDGTITLTNTNPSVPFTLKVTSSVTRTNSGLVTITQINPNTQYTVTINGIDYRYVSGNLVQDANEIAQGLATEINAVPNLPYDASVNPDGTLLITAVGIENLISIQVSPNIMSLNKSLAIDPLVASGTPASDLDAINNANSQWYALIATERDPAIVQAIAAWVETHIKLFGTASSDLTIINVEAGTDVTSIAAVLNQAGYIRTFVMYHQDADHDFPEAAWFGKVLPLEPGSETWKFKTLAGVSYSNLTTSQSNTAHAKKANTYEFVGGVGITEEGTVAQGEFIDIIRGIDWLTARIQEYVFSVLVNNPKVPYTDAGIAVIQSEVLRALKQGIANQLISDSPAPVVTVPLAANVPTADKANRILRDVRFTATLAGAIHAVVIRGTVSV